MQLFALWSKVEYSSALSALQALVFASEYCIGDAKPGSFERVTKALYVVIPTAMKSRNSLPL